MCGIVGYIGDRPVQEVLLEGLRKLEYRGYDSAGISILNEGGFDSVRAVGNLDALDVALSEIVPAEATPVALAERAPTTGIGHTRWATHGRVNEANAHPHSDDDERVHVVVNGIVENYMEIKQALLADGATFSSETDAEVVAHLISQRIEAGDDLVAAVLAAYDRIRGHYAFVAVSADEPELLVGARKECPLVIGRGEGEQFVASAIPAFLAHTRQVQLIENDEIVVVRRDGVEFLSAAGEPIERAVDEVDWSQEVAEKGGYETFMLKEIHEQADAVAETIADRTARGDGVDLGELGTIDDAFLRDCNRIVVVACGTSYHAGLIGRYALEQWARVPVEMDIASEYRYRDPVVGAARPRRRHHPVGRDRRHARRHAPGPGARGEGPRGHEHHGLAGHPRRRRGPLHPRGPRGRRRRHQDLRRPGRGDVPARAAARRAARHAAARAPERARRPSSSSIPHYIDRDARERADAPRSTAPPRRTTSAEFFLYLGRHVGLPVCLEGALKLKEISYIATDAYAAGEMKHGPIALLSEKTPVVVVATESPVLEKVVSNMQEVRARGAHVIAVASEGDLGIGEHAEEVLRIPRTDWMLQPILAVIPLQLLAYRIARLRGLNVDQPRNLAKTVTVE